ncbi:DUF3800 domain-containing protein [Cupriavidus oxalaticus]|uniref:DUF3800 domain-containing protein n=1 Tax=Cupriavidus oxalaticus TaxID=96344 RepID=A0A4P7LTL7_9BURK|nr:DUF3800 domain-containing protein [Cupriavidus oxalaticus]QBY55997.1 hypothetical protein E0W60_33610 [Cupriavidus oxalaticus]
MHIFIDESGTFTYATDRDSWCIVAAYAAPEYCRRQIETLIRDLRKLRGGAETKLKHLTEEQYALFLQRLSKLEGAAFAVAVDVGLHRREAIEHHRDLQAAAILSSRDKMRFEEGRQLLANLSGRIGALKPQLYTQLICQVKLFHQILSYGLLYFVQRNPPSLGNFRWRVDQKASAPTEYEEVFRDVLPAMLQTASLAEPMFSLQGADYRHFERFRYPPGEAPTYLKTDYGIDVPDADVNVGKIVGEDFQLVDSAKLAGVQVADLLASGLSRLLRGGFSDPDRISLLLGANFVQPPKGQPVVRLGSLDAKGRVADDKARLIRRMGAAAKSMLDR